MLRPISEQELEWTKAQPVNNHGPSLNRLRVTLRRAGFVPAGLSLTDGGEGLELRLLRSRRSQRLNRESVLRRVISTLRGAGFNVGFSEVAITEWNDVAVAAFSYTAPLQELAAFGAPQVEP